MWGLAVAAEGLEPLAKAAVFGEALAQTAKLENRATASPLPGLCRGRNYRPAAGARKAAARGCRAAKPRAGKLGACLGSGTRVGFGAGYPACLAARGERETLLPAPCPLEEATAGGQGASPIPAHLEPQTAAAASTHMRTDPILHPARHPPPGGKNL